VKLLNRREHLELLLERSDGEEDVLLGELDSSRDESLEVGLVLVLSEAGDLSGGSHLDSEDRVGSVESRERELRDLDSDVVLGKLDLGVGSDGEAEHDLGGHLDGVDSSDLGDEGS